MMPFEDDDIMFMGKYRGQRLEKVPAGYLLWMWDAFLWNHEGFDDKMRLKLYIQNSFTALVMDAPDYDVLHPYPPR